MRFYALFNGQSVATVYSRLVYWHSYCFYALFNGQSVATGAVDEWRSPEEEVSMPFLTGSLLQQKAESENVTLRCGFYALFNGQSVATEILK